MDVFAKLPYKILWKAEAELPGKPDNVLVSKWFPQQSVLGIPILEYCTEEDVDL